MLVGDKPAPGHLCAGQTGPLPSWLRDRGHFADCGDPDRVYCKMAHHRLQHLSSEVRGKSFRDPSSAFGCCPANNSILKNISNQLVSEGVGVKCLILDCLEEIIEYTLHLFWNINILTLGLGGVVALRGDQRLPFQSDEY